MSGVFSIGPKNGDHESAIASPGPELASLLERYERFLRGQRGLSENTVRIYCTDLTTFITYLSSQGLGLADMDRQLLRGYVAWLATQALPGGARKAGSKGREGYARVSVVRKVTALRAFYRFLVGEGLFTANPMPPPRSLQIKVEKGLPEFLGHRETERLLEAPADDTPRGLRDRAILEVLYGCGVRLAEIHGMNVADLDMSRREALVRGKGSKERWVLFGEPAQIALRRYLEEARPLLAASSTTALFLNRYGKRLSRRSIEKLVERYAAQAGLRDGVHTHTLRHTFASHMLEGDADLRVIQELLGHSSPTTTQVYTHVTKQEARQAYLSFHPLARESGQGDPVGPVGGEEIPPSRKGG